MLFSSLIFLFAFLPIAIGIYFMARTARARNWVLLAASLVFYAWGGMHLLCLMLAVVALNWAGAMLMGKSRLRLGAVIVANFAILFYYKYMNFFVSQMGGTMEKIILPIGISFYIFQAVSYLVDVFRGDARLQKNPFKLALYIALFPQLVAGPIVRYDDVDDQIEKRRVVMDDILWGVRRFIIGLGKKVLIANTMAKIADGVFDAGLAGIDAPMAWIGLIAYSFQIFFDFSGYSDMAIGLMRVFGFKIPENFNYPYIAKSITDFWRRWHISLSTWFKEYLYIPLGGNRAGHTYRNLWIVFLATGIWHGAEWTFVLWGLWHGLFIVIEKKIGVDRFRGVLAHFYAMAVVLFGWLLFRSPDIKFAINYAGIMFGANQGTPAHALAYYAERFEIAAFIAAVALATPLFSRVIETRRQGLLNAWLIVLFVASASFLAAGTYNPFIYFRF